MSTAAVERLPIRTATAPPLGWLVPAAGLVLATAGSLICLLVAGPLHGVMFGACVVAVTLTPSLVAADRRAWPGTVLAATAVAAGSAAGPVVAVLGGDLNGRLLLACAGVVTALAFGLAGLTALIARVAPGVAAAVVTVLALAWLGWPVWLSPWLAGNEWLVGWLSPAHPLLALDAAINRDGGVPWAEHRLMYSRLTVLGQHVFPRPPAGVGSAVVLHLAVGLLTLGGTAVADAVRRRGRDAQGT